MKTTMMMGAVAAALALPAQADDFTAPVAAGYPGVFRWVKMVDKAFVPGVNAALEGTGHSIAFDGQYGGAIAKVGDELETVEAGLAEIGICQSLFDPAKLAVQNVTYYTPFVSDAEQAIAAAEAGAAILQLHARNPVNGAPSVDPAHFAEMLPRIREADDVVNIPTAGNPIMTVAERTPPALTYSPEMCSMNMRSKCAWLRSGRRWAGMCAWG